MCVLIMIVLTSSRPSWLCNRFSSPVPGAFIANIGIRWTVRAVGRVLGRLLLVLAVALLLVGLLLLLLGIVLRRVLFATDIFARLRVRVAWLSRDIADTMRRVAIFSRVGRVGRSRRLSSGVVALGRLVVSRVVLVLLTD